MFRTDGGDSPTAVISVMMTLMSPHEPMSSEGLTIDELAARAGVTPRTVHYYVAQGLLPGPGKQGPRTRYAPAFLDLLLRIRMLQNERGLSLRSIRDLFEREGLIAPRTRGRRSSRTPTSRTTTSRTTTSRPRSSNLETEIHPSGTESSDAPDRDAAAPADVAASPTATDLLRALRKLVGDRPVPSAGSGDRWVTIPISRDLVLAGRRLRNDDLHALQRAADHLRFILLNGKRS